MFILLSTCYQLLTLLSGARGAPVGSEASLLSSAHRNLTILETEIAPAWTSSATYRGTSDILWSCLITLGACIYNAIHLNVPPHHLGWFKSLLRKLLWVGMALFAPELVLFTAYSQFQEARNLVKELNRLRFGGEDGKRKRFKALLVRWTRKLKGIFHHSDGKQVTKESPEKPNKFDLTYGFYAVMGGFVVDVRDMNKFTPQVTLSPKALIILAELDYYVDCNPEIISDKSKANTLGKGLVCIQVSWMVIQCIARKAAGYPLTLLELHTMVHVVCALILYTLWLKKPLDITDPTVVDPAAVDSSGVNLDNESLETTVTAATTVENPNDESHGSAKATKSSEVPPSPGDNPEFISIIAFLLIQSSPSLTQVNLPKQFGLPEAVFLHILKERDLRPATASPDREIQASPLPVERRYQIEPLDKHNSGVRVTPLESGKEDILRWRRAAAAVERCGKVSRVKEMRRSLQPEKSRRSSEYDLRWSYATREAAKHSCHHESLRWNIELKGRSMAHNSVFRGSLDSLDMFDRPFGGAAFNSPYVPDLEQIKQSTLPAYCNLSFFEAVLLLHASDFPQLDIHIHENLDDLLRFMQKHELLLFLYMFLPALYGGIHLSAWKFNFPTRTEALLWKIASFAIIGVGILIFAVNRCVWSIFGHRNTKAGRAVHYFLQAVTALLVLFYGLSRIYIVAEAFISLRHVPIGVYAAVPWTQSIPHI